MTTEPEKFDQFALIEIFGHRRLAGRVTEQSIGGTNLLRVDVPATQSHPAWTTFIGGSAIFSLSIASEDICRRHAEYLKCSPVMVYEIQQQLLPAPPHAERSYRPGNEYDQPGSDPNSPEYIF